MTVLNRKTHGMPPDAVYIGRPSKWGNPFAIGRDGTRREVIAMYEVWLREQLDTGVITHEELAALHGKDLVCWCTPLPCHGHVLEHKAKEAFALLHGEG